MVDSLARSGPPHNGVRKNAVFQEGLLSRQPDLNRRPTVYEPDLGLDTIFGFPLGEVEGIDEKCVEVVEGWWKDLIIPTYGVATP